MRSCAIMKQNTRMKGEDNMEKKIVRYGVIGVGRGGYVASVGLDNPDCKLVAACDINEKKLASFKADMEKRGVNDIQYFTDFDEMLKTDIEAVIVATDAIYHVPFVRRAMEAGKHVLSEIPSINTVEEAYELKEIVSSHPNLIYMAAENCCYWAFIETWKKMYDRGDFGEIVYAEAEYLHGKNPDDFAPPADPNHWRLYNPAIKYITHELGPLLYIMNDRCVSVTCMEADVEYDPYSRKKAVGVALLKTAKGAVIRILICFGAYTSYDHNYRLCGTRGQIMTDPTKNIDFGAHSFANLHSIPGTFGEKIELPITARYVDEYGNSNVGAHGGADPLMFKDFIDCVRENKAPKLDVNFAIQMSLPGILAHESAVQGGAAVEIPEI